jgi:hypothetical protein
MPLRWLRSPILLFFATPFFPQQTTAPLLIRFHVAQGNQSATTLTANDFVAIEDEKPLSITDFWNGETPPVELIFLLDSSTPFDRFTQLRPDPSLDVRELASMMARSPVEIRAAVYGYSSGLKRFCPPTRDPAVLYGAFDGAMGVRYLQRHELYPNPDATEISPDINPPFASEQRIPSPGKRVPGVTAGRQKLSWNEALIATAQAVAREPSNATRIVIPLLNGLPQPGWDPQEVVPVYQQLGFLLYPKVQLRRWIQSEKWALTHGKPERPGSPAAPGLDWKKMTTTQKLAWLDQEDSIAKSYEALGSSPPYRTIPSLIAAEIASIYIASVTPRSPSWHKIEIHLRDTNLGQIVGGVRLPPPPPNPEHL